MLAEPPDRIQSHLVEEPVRPKAGPFARIVGMLGRVELGDLSDIDRERIMRDLFHDGHRFGPFARRFAALMTMSVLIAVMGPAR